VTGFRAGRSTIDQLFTLRRLAETYSEFSRYLHVCYVDFQKAFDNVWRIELWRVMRFLGYEDKIRRILEALYQNTDCSEGGYRTVRMVFLLSSE